MKKVYRFVCDRKWVTAYFLMLGLFSLILEGVSVYINFLADVGLDLSMYIEPIGHIWTYQFLVFIWLFIVLSFFLKSKRYNWTCTAVFLGSVFYFFLFMIYTIAIWRGEAELSFNFENDFIYKIHAVIVAAFLIQYIVVNRKRIKKVPLYMKKGYKRYKEIKERRKADEMSIVRKAERKF